MKLSDRDSTKPRVPLAKLVFLLATALAAGCVNLNKPEKVQACATAGNCSDNPNQPDANDDSIQPGPDLPSGDATPVEKDSAPDGPTPDAPADKADQGPDQKEDGRADGKEAGDSSDGPPADSGLDLGPDTAHQDVKTDSGSDAGPDTGLDTGPDVGPDVGPDTGPDVGPDTGPDTPPDANPLLVGLLAYYKCESATGTTLPDSSGKNNNGTLGAAGYAFAAGKVGNALTLAKASSAYVTLPPAMFANVTDITIATWVNVTTSQNWARIFDVGVNAKLSSNTATGTHYLNLVPQNDVTPANLAFAISNNGYGSEQKLTTAVLATGTWKHVAVVLASGQGSLYVDGALVAGPSAIALRPSDLGTIDYAYLGKSQFTADPYFDGRIDELRIYGRALSATEIQALYQFAGP